jgi:hypothetical protein
MGWLKLGWLFEVPEQCVTVARLFKDFRLKNIVAVHRDYFGIKKNNIGERKKENNESHDGINQGTEFV